MINHWGDQRSRSLKFDGVYVNDAKLGIIDDLAVSPQSAILLPAEFKPVWRLEKPSLPLDGYTDVVGVAFDLPKPGIRKLGIAPQRSRSVFAVALRIRDIGRFI